MKLNKTLTLMGVAAIALASCNNEEAVQQRGTAAEPAFNASITRMSVTTWDDGDKVGIFMINGEEAAAKNVAYTSDKAGKLTAESDGIKYPDETSTVNFKAYYPFTADAAEGKYAVDLSNQSDLTKIDLIYSDDATGKYEQEQVNLTFSHKLAMVNFAVKADENAADYTLQLNAITDGSFDLLKGEMTLGETKMDFDLTLTEGKTQAIMVMPGTKPVVKVTMGDVTKEVAIEELEAGESRTETLNITGKTPADLTVTLGKNKINNWNETEDKIDIDFNENEEEVDPETPVDPEPTPVPVEPEVEYEEAIIVDENFDTGKGALTSKREDEKMKAGVNDLIFTKVSGKPDIRYRKDYKAYLWLNPAEVKVSGFDIKNCKNVKLTMNLIGKQGIATCTVKFNGNEIKTEKFTGKKTITVVLSEDEVKEESTFSIKGSTQLCVKTIKITAEKPKAN